MKVGVIGCGVVGETVACWLEQHEHDVLRYDPPKGWTPNLDECNTVFICVPTPVGIADGQIVSVIKPGATLDKMEIVSSFVDSRTLRGGSDMSLVKESVLHLRGEKTVIIKSTVLPGTTDLLQSECPEHTFFFVPEFLSEDTAASDYASQLVSMIGVPGKRRWNHQVVGIEVECLWRDNLIPRIPGKELLVVSALVAETYKLMRNAYLATKVIFFNEIYDLCEKAGIDFSELRALATGDPWILGNHTDALHKGYRGYGGKCFPKDVNALIAYAKSLGVDLGLLKEVRRVNECLANASPAFSGAIRTSGKSVQA